MMATLVLRRGVVLCSGPNCASAVRHRALKAKLHRRVKTPSDAEVMVMAECESLAVTQAQRWRAARNGAMSRACLAALAGRIM